MACTPDGLKLAGAELYKFEMKVPRQHKLFALLDLLGNDKAGLQKRHIHMAKNARDLR